jgi:transcriptional regulator with XRE-family HTH domain
MGAISETLRQDLTQPEFSEGYAESFQDAYVATQIKVLREQNEWTQAELAEVLNTTQTAVSRIENVNYSAWNISTLKKLARAFRVRLKVSFESYGSLINDVENFSRENLKRAPREKDPELAIGIQDVASAATKLFVDIGQFKARKQDEPVPVTAYASASVTPGNSTQGGAMSEVPKIPPSSVGANMATKMPLWKS